MRRWGICVALAAAGCMDAPDEGGAVEARQSALADESSDGILIQFRAGTSDKEEAAARDGAGVVRRERVAAVDGDLELVDLPPGLAQQSALARIAAHPAVRFAEPNWRYFHQDVADDPYFTNGALWGMYSGGYGCHADAAWAAGHTGADHVYVGVVDEGIQTTHPDLAANIGTNPGEIPNDDVDNDGNGYVDDVNGWDFVKNDNTVYDGGKKGTLDQHGTHVAGTIAAVGHNGLGVAGVCWHVKLISAKFLGRNGGTTANAVKALDYLTDLKTKRGLNIVATNNSWGGGGYSQALLAAIARAARADILFIVAAGNGNLFGVGQNNDAVAYYPANYDTSIFSDVGYDSVVAVAAIDSSGAKATFSNYGLKAVDLGAPGVGIYSTLPYGKYGSYSGTSMATPHVTGAVALYASWHPGIRAVDLKAAILKGTIGTSSLSGKTVTGGRLNAGLP